MQPQHPGLQRMDLRTIFTGRGEKIMQDQPDDSAYDERSRGAVNSALVPGAEADGIRAPCSGSVCPHHAVPAGIGPPVAGRFSDILFSRDNWERKNHTIRIKRDRAKTGRVSHNLADRLTSTALAQRRSRDLFFCLLPALLLEARKEGSSADFSVARIRS